MISRDGKALGGTSATGKGLRAAFHFATRVDTPLVVKVGISGVDVDGAIKNLEGGVPSVGAWLHRATVFESKRVLRDRLNQRKRDAMIRNELFRNDGHGDTGGSTWDDIRPHLDEALQRLPARDRDVLVLHYFDGLKFKDVAARLGLRAEAAQKRARRALEKLGRTLRAWRGITLPTAVLATGLTQELCQAAPASVVSKLGTTGATTSSAEVLTLMTTTTTKTVATTATFALALFAASVGSGYVIGEKSARRPSLEAGVGGLRDDAAGSDSPVVAGIELDSGRDLDLVPDDATARAKFFVTVRALLAEREQLSDEGTMLMEGARSEDEIDHLFARLEGVELRGLAAADALPAADLKGAIASLESDPSADLRALGRRFLLTSWGRRDPDGALEAMGDRAVDAAPVFHGFAMRDARVAVERLRQLGSDNRSVVRSALGGLFQGWVAVEPAAAIEAFGELDFDEQKVARGVFRELGMRPSIRAGMIRAVADVRDEASRADIVLTIGAGWAEVMPRAAFAWFDRVPFKDRRTALPVARAMFSSATRTGYSAEAVDWIWARLPADQRPEFLTGEIAGAWAREDEVAAAAWQAKHGIVEEPAP